MNAIDSVAQVAASAGSLVLCLGCVLEMSRLKVTGLIGVIPLNAEKRAQAGSWCFYEPEDPTTCAGLRHQRLGVLAGPLISASRRAVICGSKISPPPLGPAFVLTQ